jgi:hypothetical protein
MPKVMDFGLDSPLVSLLAVVMTFYSNGRIL